MSRHRWIFLSISILFMLALGCQPQAEPVNGAEGIGDPYYPQLGNGGYDVKKYTIVMDVDPATNTVHGRTMIQAKATERLASFSLDFQGMTVDSVIVNGRSAPFARKEPEMTITPSKPLALGRVFTVEVTYRGTPITVMSEAIPEQVGWFHAKDGTINVFTEPDGASAWFPNNNHPRDKASYHFDVKVPNPWIVAATGVLKKTIAEGNSTRYLVDLDEPAASYLVAINIGRYDLVEAEGPNDIHIRNYFPRDYPETLRKNFNQLPEMIKYLSSLYGPYPFKEYGVVIGSSQTELCSRGTADETQTLTIHCPQQALATEAIIVHELAHQWFGDQVSLENWKDIWLKEGMATYTEWLWITRDKDLETLNKVVKVQTVGYYPSSATGEPPPGELYQAEVYKGGALVFHALRLKVGEEAFFKILRTYQERYGGKSAGTDEFIALAEEISGQDLQDFFASWLLSDKPSGIPGLGQP